jgi:hypothetical protein
MGVLRYKTDSEALPRIPVDFIPGQVTKLFAVARIGSMWNRTQFG